MSWLVQSIEDNMKNLKMQGQRAVIQRLAKFYSENNKNSDINNALQGFLKYVECQFENRSF